MAEAPVHEIFISYSSKHRELTRALATAIEAQYGAGSVWWDQELESRAGYAEQIRAALEQARVVVVIWTAGAMVSNYVYAEAATAADKLVNVRPADMSYRDIPEPFNIYHIDEAEDHARILATIAKVMNGTPIPTRVPLHEIYFRQHGRRIIDTRQQPLPRDVREISPTDLLQASYAVVPYVDVAGMQADLVAWCRGASNTAGRLVHGPGGLGKTRLLIEVAAPLRREGWMAGFFDRAHEQANATLRQRWQALEQLIAHGEDQGLLIVVDYAEGRQDEVKALAERLGGRPPGETRPIRVVLLARSAGDWWRALHDETPAVQRLFRRGPLQADVVALSAIATADQRRALFDESLEAFAPTLAAQGFAVPAGEPARDLLHRIETEENFARPLAVQMEALVWLASGMPEAASPNVAVLLDRVLGLERAHWQKLLGALDEDAMRDMARGVAAFTVVGGAASSASAERLLMADPFYQGQRAARAQVAPVMGRLARIYGKPDGTIAPLEPDLIGEHHAATVADADLIEGCLRWIDSEPVEEQPKRRRAVLTVLQRATQPEHGEAAERATALLDHLIGGRTQTLADDMVAVMVETPGHLAERLARKIDELDDAAVEAIEATLPPQSLALPELSLRVAWRLAIQAQAMRNAAEAAAELPPEVRLDVLSHHADRQDTLGIRRADLGQLEQALAATQEAVDTCRTLVEIDRNSFLPRLAGCLHNLGTRFSALGRNEDALAPAQEAATIRRSLAQARSETFLADLARSLNNLGIRFAKLQRPEEALAASREAVEIRTALATKQPEVFEADLASSLANFAADLLQLDHDAEALAAAEKARDIYRRLADSQPDAFLPQLAASLNNAANMLAKLHRDDEALKAAQECVTLYREIAQVRPETLLPKLAGSLCTLGRALSRAGRHSEAVDAAHEGLRLIVPFVQSWPQAFKDIAHPLVRLHAEECARAGEEVDFSLLEQIGQALGVEQGVQADPELSAMAAKIDAVLENIQRTNTLDEAMLAELPADLADQIRAAFARGLH
jgi:hypothetical protein